MLVLKAEYVIHPRLLRLERTISEIGHLPRTQLNRHASRLMQRSRRKRARPLKGTRNRGGPIELSEEEDSRSGVFRQCIELYAQREDIGLESSQMP
jgi:hypothetical protein